MDLHPASEDQRQEVGNRVRFTLRDQSRCGIIEFVGAGGNCLIISSDGQYQYVVLVRDGRGQWTWGDILVTLEE